MELRFCRPSLSSLRWAPSGQPIQAKASVQPDVELVEDRVEEWSSSESRGSALHDLTLSFETDSAGGRVMLRLIPGASLITRFKEIRGPVPLPLSVTGIVGAVAACQAVWWRHVIEAQSLWSRLGARPRPFFWRWKRPVSQDKFQTILEHLAEAGLDLFVAIFSSDDEADAKTEQAASVLQKALLEESGLRILVRGAKIVAPWNLLYVGDTREAPNVESFVGFRHVIEHDFSSAPTVEAEMPFPTDLAFHCDRNIDSDDATGPFRALECFNSLFEHYRIQPNRRDDRKAFGAGLSNGASESIFFFLCHATAGNDEGVTSEGLRLFLTRDSSAPDELAESEAITPANIQTWLRLAGGPLRGQPIVFINACQGTRAGSIYYSGFAERFLSRSARAVIGPEIEMPVVVACDFARRVLEAFFQGGSQRTLGQVLLQVRQEYLRDHLNPLGLTYSLFRGSHVYLSQVSALPAAPDCLCSRPEGFEPR